MGQGQFSGRAQRRQETDGRGHGLSSQDLSVDQVDAPQAPDGLLYPARHDPAAAVSTRVRAKFRAKDIGRLDERPNRTLLWIDTASLSFGWLSFGLSFGWSGGPVRSAC
jgi:hypothetical protein